MSDIACSNPEKMGSPESLLSDIAHRKSMQKIKKRKRKTHFSVHFSFLILMTISFFLGLFKVVFSYFFFLCLHECVHAFVAKKLGYGLGKIELSASGAVLDANEDEFSFKDEILIAISGPLFNLFVAFLLIAFWWIYPESYNFLQDEVVVNFAIFSFNILPFFPLDGGRILLGFLSKKIERKSAVKICKTITFVFSILLFFVFVFSLFKTPVFSIGVASVNLFLSAILENKNAVYRRLFLVEKKVEKSKNGGVEGRIVYVHESVTYLSLLRLIDARHFTVFRVIDDSLRVKKEFLETELQSLIEREVENQCSNSSKK